MRSLVSVCVLLASSAAFAWGWGGVQGNGKLVEQSRDVGEFHAVQITHGIRAEIRVGPATSVKLSGDENLLALIETRVEDGKLIVDTRDEQGLRPTREIRIQITTPKLDEIAASGGSKVKADRLEGQRASVAASGGGEIRVARVSVGALNVAASGGSELRLDGKADDVEIAMSGGSELHAAGLAIDSLNVVGSGGSTAELKVASSIQALLSGGSEVQVEGNPRERQVQASGGSAVHYEG